MPHIVRLVTALVAGFLLWLAFDPPSLLRIWIYGSWALGVVWIGLVLAAQWKDTE
jgi:hypothetical protein